MLKDPKTSFMNIKIKEMKMSEFLRVQQRIWIELHRKERKCWGSIFSLSCTSFLPLRSTRGGTASKKWVLRCDVNGARKKHISVLPVLFRAYVYLLLLWKVIAMLFALSASWLGNFYYSHTHIRIFFVFGCTLGASKKWLLKPNWIQI